MRDRPAGCATCASGLCGAAAGGRRVAADVDGLLVAMGRAGGAEDQRRAPATTGHRAAACDQHDTRRHTATSMMLMLLLRPPAAQRGSATGSSTTRGIARSAVYYIDQTRAQSSRARGARRPSAVGQRSDPRSDRPAGACWPPSPFLFRGILFRGKMMLMLLLRLAAAQRRGQR